MQAPPAYVRERRAPTLREKVLYSSDRLITPGTVSVAMVCTVQLVLGLVAWSTLAHVNVSHILNNGATFATAIGTIVNTLALVTQRHQSARIDAHVGRLAAAVATEETTHG